MEMLVVVNFTINLMLNDLVPMRLDNFMSDSWLEVSISSVIETCSKYVAYLFQRVGTNTYREPM